MRICWFNENRLGVVEEDQVFDVTEALLLLPKPQYPLPRHDVVIEHLRYLRPELRRLRERGKGQSISDVRLTSPVANPSKIIGVPVNYLKHVEEAAEDVATFTDRYRGSIQEQGFFLKANSALVGPDDGIALRFGDRRNDHEMELGVIIGKRANNVAPQDALSYVAGYAIALDMVVRGPEDRSMRKSIDSYAVLGPWLVTADEVADPNNLSFELRVNGELRQSSNTKNLILSIAEQIAWASRYYTLLPGDIIMTGTCEGVGPVLPGDQIDCSIQSIGAMQVKLRAA